MSLGMVFLLFFASTVPFVAGKSLLKLKIEADRSSYKGCSQTGVESCVPADLDIDLLKTGDSIEILDGTELMLSHRSHNSAVFQNGAAEAVFTWAGVHVAGQVHANGNSWALEGCGEGCFLWIKQKNDWLDEVTAPTLNHKKGFFQVPENMKKLQDQGLSDTTTEVTYSVMIWYTPQFYAQFATEADMNVFVDLIFAETNQGYINSQMPVRVSKLGPQLHPTLVDINNSSALVNDFEDSMPQHELLNCADAAALLINDFSSCGIAKFGTTSSCRTFSVTKKSCATGYYSFGHEIGHNFGATHNPEQFSSTSGDGYAHLILPTGPSKYTGYRTILGYNADGHYNRVNYYSNPDLIFPTTGTATGVTDLSNNARVISANRFAMAACGTDEPNGVCNDCSINPAAEICLTCTNADFLNSGYSVFAGTYSVYTDNPTVNDRKVYKLDGSSTAYCLFYAVGRWAISSCDNVGSGSYYVKSADTSKKCVHGVTNWQWSSNPDPTMTVECPGSCASDPPSPPSGVNSDWGGSSKNAGTVVTYSCSSSDSTKKSVCDPNTLTWNPATIPSDLCSDSSTTTTRTSSTTTTTTTESTTTTETTTTTSTTTTTTTTTTTSTTTEANIKCVDQGCMDSFQGDGECVDTLTLDWSSLDTVYDLQAGTKDGKCSITCNCQCLKKKMCPIESKKCMKKKGQCVSPSSTPPQGWYYAGFLCDTKNKCKCYQQCKSSGCEKKKGVCLIPTADTIPFGFKMKGACNKKAKCFCYVPICSPNPSCSNKGGECYGKGMSVPSGAKYLGWCNKSQKCKCYKIEATTTTTTTISTTCSNSQITIPAAFIGIDIACIDKMDIILMRDSLGKVEGYNANGACGLNSIAQLPETKQWTGGGLAYVGQRLISFGGWEGGYDFPNTWEYSFSTNTWISIGDMADMSPSSYFSITQTAIGFNTLGEDLAFYFASPELQTFDPSSSTWTLQNTGIIDIWTMGVVAVGHYLIIFDGATGNNVWKYNPNTNTNQQLPSLPVTAPICYYPKAVILEPTSGVGIMVVCTDGRTFFCLLDRLEWQTPSGWNALPSVDPTTTSGTMLAYVEGKMQCLRGGNAWQWDDASETWLAAPGGYTAYQQNYGRTTYTTIPKNLVPDC